MKKYQYLASWDDQTLTRVGEPVVVLGDSNVSQVEVILPSDFLLDPTGAVARMYFLLPGEKESGFETLETATKDDNGDSHVTWTIKHAYTQKGGRLAFSLTLIGDDAQWDSRTAIIPVYESRYQPESEEAEEPYTGRLAALEGSMASIRGEFAEVQEDFEDLKETATLGTPIPESLVANMQEGHVYIYTGTEPGYTAGHVYYYVGGVLKDGGLYGGTTVDATLTVSGAAADAKKTGDEISQIKEDLSATRADFTNDLTWERKGISSGNGSLTSSTTRLASGYVPKEATHIYCDVGYKYVLAAYDGTTYIGEWNGSEFVKSATWLTEEVDISAFGNYNLRICLAYANDATITLDGASGLHLYALTDTTLTQQGKPADAKEVGKRLDAVESFAKDAQGLLRIEKKALDVSFNDITKVTSNTEYHVNNGTLTVATTDTKAWKQAYIENIGNWLVNGKTYRLRCEGKVVSGNGVLRVSFVKASWGLITEKSLFIADGDIGEMIFVKNAEMATLAFSVTGASASQAEVMYYGFEIAEVVEYSAIDNDMRVLNADSWRVANIIANANNVMDIKWTPVGNMPKNNGGYFDIAEQTGLPYSSARDQDKAIGMDVSIYTFMSALRDPNSVLYKRRSTVANSSAYYGTVCSGLINYSTGIGLNLTNYFLGECDLFETIPMQSIIPGDMIWISGHCALVYATKKDKYGRIAEVIVAEEWQPLPRYVIYDSWDAFTSGRSGYIARRYKKEYNVPHTAIPWVQNFDEVEETVIYPDIQTDHGDKAVFMVGEDVLVNVIDAKDYTQIVVDRAGTTVQTLTTIEAFTLSNVQPGLYTITASGGANTSVSTFFVVDASGSFDTSTGIVTFSSTNATPVMVNVYNLPANRNITARPIILTDADRATGRLDVSSYMDADYQYAKVTFMTDYGTAVWYSETHEKWTPIS